MTVFRRSFGLALAIMIVCLYQSPAASDSYHYLPNGSPDIAELGRLLGEFQDALREKDGRRIASMINPDSYVGPPIEAIIRSVDEAIPAEMQSWLLKARIEDAYIHWFKWGVALGAPGTPESHIPSDLAFYPRCKDGKCGAMNIYRLETPAYLKQVAERDAAQEAAASTRKQIVSFDDESAVRNFIQGSWQTTEMRSCGMVSGGAVADAEAIIGSSIRVSGNTVEIPVGGAKSASQVCQISTNEPGTFEPNCLEPLGYIRDPSVLTFRLACEAPTNNSDIYMKDRWLYVADGGNVVLLSVWEAFVAMERKSE